MKRVRKDLILPLLILVSTFNSCNVKQEGDQNIGNILLKDFKPISLYNIPKTEVAEAMYPIIDAHSHVYAQSGEEITNWVKTMDEIGVEKTIVLTQAVGEEFDSLINEFAKYPGRFDLWCGFDYTNYDKPGYGPDAVKELERCFKAGAKGVGELGDKGKGMFFSSKAKAWGMHFDDERLAPLLAKCGELGMPVSIHVADPIWMYEKMDSTNDGMMNALNWRLDNQEVVGHAEMIDILERAVKRHPETTFVTCHLGNCSYDLNKLGGLLDKYPNLYADISARFGEIATIPRFAAKFFQKYQDRLLYGTDSGMKKSMYKSTFRILETEDEHFYNPDYGYHWTLNGLALDTITLRKIYRENALKIL
ncbi:MAG: amidohydrolase family protein [Candidatus Heimdallarchaeota archaeon]|nr:amidohydrolase family protein [Candidatus Heimdallarchaeota archaeon]